MYFNQSLRGTNEPQEPFLDADGDGFVDGSANYKLVKDGVAINLTNRRGRTFSDQTNGTWDAIKAVDFNSGFKVLLAGSNRKSGQFRVWDVNSTGVISSLSSWISTTQALEEGWESLFGDIIQPDGVIGSPDSGTPAPEPTPTPEPEPTPTPEPEPTPTPEPSLDADGDGFVDGSANYKLVKDSIAINLTNRRGRTFSDETNATWDAIKAVDFNSGFKILLAGSNNKSGRFRVWDVRSTGVISSASSWLSTTQALEEGWESLFGDIIQPDGVIGKPSNDGSAIFHITGTPEVDQTLRADLIANDPDGNGTFSYTWQSSNDLESWASIGSGETLDVTYSLQGRHIRSVISYTDGEGFEEEFISDVVTISSDDDYSSDTNTSGSIDIGSSSSGILEITGDQDWFAVQLESGERYQFDLIGSSLEDPYLYLHDAEGNLLRDDDDGGSGLNSRITFEANDDGRYFLGAGAYSDAYAGTYTLSATQLAPPDLGFNPTDGFGHVNAKRAFENLLDISLSNQPELGGNLWGLDNINAPEVWAGGDGFGGVTGENITIAVIDTGVDSNHSEFSGRIVAGYDFVDDDTTAEDGNGHGTHVAGTIAAANDGKGITGVAYDAYIMPIRVLDDRGYGSFADVIAGIHWATDNGADVINLSLGGGYYSQSMFDAVQHASENGSVVVMAAGNEYASAPGYPAAHAVSYGLAIGAVDQNKGMADFSNRAGSIEMDYVTAPGVDIYSTSLGGGYSLLSGTSMAAPHVAGVAGLLKSHDSNLTASAIETLLSQSASNATSNSNLGLENTTSAIKSSNFTADLSQVITLETLDNFSSIELKDPLIGNLSGNREERKITFDSINRKVDRDHENYADLNSFETLNPSENLFSSLDFHNSINIDPKDTLRELLMSKQFDYFEFDQTIMAI
uniref:S8 family serine peptidase n=1 Tax=Synechococcus sp. UW106 TaxID=368495 RepID=UPI000E0EA4CB|nr:S8 family serine peptidase [Synechococcus sp. UW106]